MFEFAISRDLRVIAEKWLYISQCMNYIIILLCNLYISLKYESVKCTLRNENIR